MLINELKEGLMVTCPEDMGNLPYKGEIIFISKEVNYNINNTAFVWVSIKKLDSKIINIWPSNRLK